MNNNLLVINSVRTQQTGADTWFCLKDVLAGLGDKQQAHDKMPAIQKWFENSPLYMEVGAVIHDQITDSVNLGLTAIYKSTKIQVPDALNRMRPTTFINEPLLYWVLNRSNSPQAQKRELAKNLGLKLDLILTPTSPIGVRTLELIQQVFYPIVSHREYYVGPYYIDLYFPPGNIAVECDEDRHKYQTGADYIRQEFISEKLGCKFIRYNPHTKGFRILDVIKQIAVFLE